MSNVQEALKAAIEVLQRASDAGYSVESDDALNQCKAALADIEKCEPVYLISSGVHEIAVSKAKYDEWTSSKRISYTSPQPRDWVGLTENDIDDVYNDWTTGNHMDFAKDICEKLKQLNTKG